MIKENDRVEKYDRIECTISNRNTCSVLINCLEENCSILDGEMRNRIRNSKLVYDE